MSASFDFHSKKALVTGASQGLGYSIAVALAEAGAKVVALARSEDKLKELHKKVGIITVTLLYVVADVTSSESELAALLSSHQPFHLVVNNAGVGLLESCLSISEEALNTQIDVNLKAPIILTKIVANEMIRHSIRGAIVNISSQASMRPINNHTVY
ncbi:Dicarbonyl and L-xylulose reductase, partial [Trichostrongylus colubriformis]